MLIDICTARETVRELSFIIYNKIEFSDVRSIVLLKSFITTHECAQLANLGTVQLFCSQVFTQKLWTRLVSETATTLISSKILKILCPFILQVVPQTQDQFTLVKSLE